MALTGSLIIQALMGTRTMGASPFNGPAFVSLATGIGNGMAMWAVGQPSNLAMTGLSTGTIGAGTIFAATTRIVVPPNVAVVLSSLIGAGLTGPLAQSLGPVIAYGISSAFGTSGQYQGVVAGVGIGQDFSFVNVSNTITLNSILTATLVGAFGGIGVALPSLALGLAMGISALLLQAIGTGTVTGPPGPTPGTGTSISVVV